MTTSSFGQERGGRDLRFVVNVVLFIGILWVLMPQATGIPLHEWGSLLLLVPLLIHIVLEWEWIVAVTKRLFGRQPRRTRFNYFWDWFLFVTMVIALFSGIAISEVVLPALGIAVDVDPFWLEVHLLSANSVIVIVGVHLAMHRSWIVTNFKRYVLGHPSRTQGGAA